MGNPASDGSPVSELSAQRVTPELDESAPAPPVSTARPAGFRHTFRALRHRNFRIFFCGQSVSLVGTWMQNLTQSWLVYRLTGSELAVGVVGFCANIPVLIMGPIAGLAADRYPRYRIMLITQITLMIQSTALAVLTLTGSIQPGQVFLLALVWGVANAFDIPARHSLYIHMVGREDLINAISMNAVMFNTARIAGPSIAGLIIAAFGEGVCFSINAVTFLFVIVSLLLLRFPPAERVRHASPWKHLRDGFRYAHSHRPVRSLLLINSLASVTRAPANALAPFFADAIFGRGARGLGVLQGAMGLGAIAGTLGLARRVDTGGLPKTVLISALTTAACLVLFAWSPSYWLSLAFFALIGFSHVRQAASTNTLIQTMIPDDYRGRLMGLYSMSGVGMVPIGHLLGGVVAERIAARPTVFAGGILCLGAALMFRRALPGVREILERRHSE